MTIVCRQCGGSLARTHAIELPKVARVFVRCVRCRREYEVAVFHIKRPKGQQELIEAMP